MNASLAILLFGAGLALVVYSHLLRCLVVDPHRLAKTLFDDAQAQYRAGDTVKGGITEVVATTLTESANHAARTLTLGIMGRS